MNLPFTPVQFLEVFTKYNNSIWPLQVFLNIAALAVIYLAVHRFRFSDRTISITLGCVWLWMGLVYHILFFASLNPAAYGFGALCALQGIFFMGLGIRKSASYQATLGWQQSLGIFFIVYALLLYPFLGMKFGHLFPAAPSFGAPCPTTIFTIGILLWANRLPRYTVIIPAMWSVIGFTAALKLGMYEDMGLLVAGLTGAVVIFTNKSLKVPLPAADITL